MAKKSLASAFTNGMLKVAKSASRGTAKAGIKMAKSTKVFMPKMKIKSLI